MERKRGCKIRKRGGSSSSSSSLARRNRFKRAIFIGKRAAQDDGGSGTPVKSIAAAKTPVLLSFSPEQLPVDHQFQKSCVSARKLAATLWEISDGTDPPVHSNRDCLRSKKPSRNRARKKTEESFLDFPPKSSDPISHLGSESERIALSKDIISCRSTVPQKLQLIECKIIGKNSVKARLKNVRDGLTTSKELAKVLKRINELGDDHKTASNRLISALLYELDRARSGLKHLMSEFDAEEEEEEEKRQLREEAVTERKLRKRTEKMNRRLGRELAEAKETERKMKEEMEREKRAKDVLEEVCDELARGIGDDKKEMEKEREMMHIADVLREERVQMKLTEAKFEFEEKHAAVERLRNELRRVLDGSEGKESSEIRRILEIIDGDGSDDDEDEEGELKSIELNMESGNKWGYVESRRDHRTEPRFVGSGEDDPDSDGPVEKRSLIVDNGERDESLKTLRDYIVSNVRFIGASSSEQWNHRNLPTTEFV